MFQEHPAIQFLDSLKARCIDTVKYESLRSEVTREGNLKLSSLLSIFPDQEWTNDFLSALPVSGASGDLLALNPTVSFRSTTGDWLEVSSVAFKIVAPHNAPLIWTITLRKSEEYRLSLQDAIEVSIAWPGHKSWRDVRGLYQAIIQRGAKEKHCVGEYSMDYQSRPQNRITFADISYRVENHTVSIRDVLDFFSMDDFGFSRRLQGIAISGLGNALSNLNEDYALKDVGFVLMGTPYVFMDEISGTFPLNKTTSELLPVKTAFSISSLRVVLQDLYRTASRKLVLQLHGNIELDTLIPFRLTSSLSKDFEVAILPGNPRSLSVQKALDIVGCSLEDFPAISNLTTSIGIYEASVGWIADAIDSLSLVLEVENWKIVEDKFVIRDLSFEIHKKISSGSKPLSLYGSGLVEICGSDLDVALEVTHSSSSSTVTFAILSTGRALRLGSILDYFSGGEANLPSNLADILNQTALDSIMVQGERDRNGWALSRFALGLGIQMQLDITGDKKLILSDPNFKVDISYPFEKKQRLIELSIEATFHVGERVVLASIVLAKTEGYSMTLQLQEQPLSLSDVISLFVDPSKLLIPPALAFLLGIGLKAMSFTLVSTSDSGKFSLTKLEATVVSPVQINLWDNLTLQDISLEFKYNRVERQTLREVVFGASLSVGKPLQLRFALRYLKGPSFPFADLPQPNTSLTPVKVTTDGGAEWSATASYNGTISVLDALSRIANVDIKAELDEIGLPGLRDVLDFNFSNSSITLSRTPNNTAFTLASQVNHSFFNGPLHLEGKLGRTWIYSVKFDVSVDDLFRELGVSAISLKNTFIMFSNGPKSNNFVDTRHGKFTVEFAGTLELGAYGPLSEVVGTNAVTIAGAITNNSFSIYAKTDDFVLFDDMKLSGALAAQVSRQSIKIAIIGQIRDIYLPDISTSKFTTSFALYAKIPSPELGLSFTLDKLENAFGCKGLHFEDIKFNAAFDSFPKPSELGLEITVRFVIGSQHFSAEAELHYSQNELRYCSAWGRFSTFPSLNEALTGFDGESRDIDRIGPDSTNGSFTDLEFAISPSQSMTVKDRQINQGYMFKGSLTLPSIDLDAAFHVEISTEQILVKGNIKKAIVFPKSGARLFAIHQDGDRDLGPYLELNIKEAFFICKMSAAVFFLGLSFETSLELSSSGLKFHNRVAVDLAVVKSAVDIYAVIDKTHIQLQISCDLEISIPLHVFDLPDVKIVTFAAVIGASVDWGRPSFEFFVAGSVEALGLPKIEVGTIAIRGNVDNLSELAGEIGQKIGRYLSDIVESMFKKGLSEVVNFLKDLGLAAVKAGEFIVEKFEEGVRAVVIQLKVVYDLAQDAVRDIADALDATKDDAIAIAEELGYAVADFVESLGYEIEKIINDIIDDICIIS